MSDGVCRGFAIHVYPEDLTRSLKPVYDVIFFKDPRGEFSPLEQSFIKDFDFSSSMVLSDDGRMTSDQLKECLDIISYRMDLLLQHFLELGIELNYAYICHDNDNARDDLGRLVHAKDHFHIVVYNVDDSVDMLPYQLDFAKAFNCVKSSIVSECAFNAYIGKYVNFDSHALTARLYDCQPIISLNAKLRYLCHLSDSTKYKYSVSDVIANFDYARCKAVCQVDDTPSFNLVADYILHNKGVTFADVYLYCLQHDMVRVFIKYHIQLNNLLKSELKLKKGDFV